MGLELIRDRSGRCVKCSKLVRTGNQTIKNGTIDDGVNFYCSEKCYKDFRKAKYIGSTGIAGVTKDRWECQNCKKKKNPECRFNLSTKKRNKYHECRFCKEDLFLEKK